MTQIRDMAVMTPGERVFTAWAGSSKIDSVAPGAIPTWEQLYPAERERWDRVALAALANRDAPGSGSSAKADPHRAAEGAVLDKDQLKAIEHAAMDAGAYSWRRARLAMVEDGKVIGYPVFSRADMAELARLYREDAPPAINTTAGEAGS